MVGLFPDVIERKVAHHMEKGDHVSALVTGEFYTRNHFPGFGWPFVFNAKVLLKVGRKLEAKDAARGALKSPWWTLGCRYQEVAEIADWEKEKIEYIKEKVSEEGKLDDLKKGKAPEQDGQYLRPSDPAYEQVLDSLAMVARHTPVPLLEALLKWRER